MPIEFKTCHFDALTTKELYSLLQLRQEVFIVEQNCPYLDADNRDLKCYHVMGYEDGALVACCRLVPAGVSYREVSIGRVISSATHRGKGIGQMLMKYALNEINRLWGEVPIRIGAQAYLKKFYEDFGFVDLNQPYLEDGIPHLIMLKGQDSAA